MKSSGYDFSFAACNNCLDCPAGRYADAAGATSCKAGCAAGRYLPTTNRFGTLQAPCADCALGLFNPTPGEGTTCTACPVGQHSDAAGASSCKAGCPRGKYLLQFLGLTNCEQCPAGRFNPDYGGSCQLFSCAAGKVRSERHPQSPPFAPLLTQHTTCLSPPSCFVRSASATPRSPDPSEHRRQAVRIVPQGGTAAAAMMLAARAAPRPSGRPKAPCCAPHALLVSSRT
jgi:hypothetical protein